MILTPNQAENTGPKNTQLKDDTNSQSSRKQETQKNLPKDYTNSQSSREQGPKKTYLKIILIPNLAEKIGPKNTLQNQNNQKTILFDFGTFEIFRKNNRSVMF